MKRRTVSLLQALLALILVLAGGCAAYANPISLQAAKDKAEKLGILPHTRGELSLVYSAQGPRTRGADIEQSEWYVLAPKSNKGFLVVAGDDTVPFLLAYSDSSTFTGEDLPEAVRAFLATYTDMVRASATGSFKQLQTRGGKSVKPLLKGLQWNQSFPYNDMAPILPGTKKHAAAGCVATAAAQVMRYYQWPKKCKAGFPKYEVDGKGEVNNERLGAVEFQWSEMQDRYPSLYGSDSQKKYKERYPKRVSSVATLIERVGKFSKMQYGKSSGTLSFYLISALRGYMGYNNSSMYVKRRFFTYEEWCNLLKKELDNKRPVYMDGVAYQNGHAFVCDGYDANGLFHMNWGWGGLANGYFLMSDMNPSEQGIGGGGVGGYVDNQGMILNLTPHTGGENTKVYVFFLESLEAERITQSASDVLLTFKSFRNYSVFPTPRDEVKIVVDFHRDGKVATSKTISVRGVWNSMPYIGIPDFSESFDLSGVSDGDYTVNVRVLVKGKACPTYRNHSAPYTFVLRKRGGQVECIKSQAVIKLKPELQNTKTTPQGVLIFNITSDKGVVPYRSYLALYTSSTQVAMNKKDFFPSDLAGVKSVDIEPGQNFTISFQSNHRATSGSYYAYLLYQAPGENLKFFNNSRYPVNILKEFRVEVISPSELAKAQSIKISGFPGSLDAGDMLSVNLEVATLGGKGVKDDIGIAIYKGLGEVATIGPQNVFLLPGQKGAYTLAGEISLDKGNYVAKVARVQGSSFTPLRSNEVQSGTKLQFQFTVNKGYDPLHGNPTDVASSTSDIIISPNPCRDYVTISSTSSLKSARVRILSLSGVCLLEKTLTESQQKIFLQNLPDGLYLLELIQDGNRIVRRFVKI